jgi:D-alanyl-D-alanine dipeptidase
VIRLAATAMLTFWALGQCLGAASLPPKFVYLRDIDPTIHQDIRYAGFHNFVGRPIAGYKAAECILTQQAALALKSVQASLVSIKQSLIVWDCYRPTTAVADFLQWTRELSDSRMKEEFYPRTDKSKLFALGYLATRSAHSRGSTVDLGIIDDAAQTALPFRAEDKLVPCTDPKGMRFEDGTLDFGTGYDCLDVLAGNSKGNLSEVVLGNRQALHLLMMNAGFKSYSKEWWHFELSPEPFPDRRFDFPVQ